MSDVRPPLAVARAHVALASSEREVLKEVEDEDFGTLLKRTVQDAARLVEQETKLLKREIELKVDRAQATVAIGAVGAIGALLTLFTATATAILGLSLVLPAWAAGLIVTALWAVASAITLGWAKKRFAEETLHPQITERSVRRDVHALGEAMR